MSSKPRLLGNSPQLSEFDQEWERIEEQSSDPFAAGFHQPGRSRANRRRGERVPTRVPVIVTLQNGVPVYCLSTDLSLSGAHLDLAAEFVPDVDVVTVCLALPDEMLQVSARPVRTTARGRAIEFVEVRPSERSRLASYILECRRAALPRPYSAPS